MFFDEPTASLDARTEVALFERIASLARDKTTIVIWHRLAIAQMVDRIIVLDRGR